MSSHHVSKGRLENIQNGRSCDTNSIFFDDSHSYWWLVKQSHTANYQTEELQRGFRMHKLSSSTVEKYATYHQKINFFYVLLLLELE